MDETPLVDRINTLAHRRSAIWARGQPDPDDSARVRELDVELDRAWDLLRRQRAARGAAADEPGHDDRATAFVRSAQVDRHRRIESTPPVISARVN